jgi:uncharacterized membrane protein YwaF
LTNIAILIRIYTKATTMSFSRALLRPMIRGFSAAETLPTKMATKNFTMSATSLVSSATKGVPSSIWNLGRLNHVAIATPDLQKSVSLYRDILGAKVRSVPSS